jgi:hypothetical protein
MNKLVKPAVVIPSHAEEAVTINGQVSPESRTAKFIALLHDMPAYVPLSGKTMEFDSDARCAGGPGCAQAAARR